MRRLARGVIGGATWLCLLSGAAASAPSETPSLNYDVDAALLYLDALRTPRNGASAIDRPRFDGVLPGLPQLWSPTAAVTQPHALGLRRLAFGMTWQASQAASLHVVLRPDAVNRHDEAGGTQLPVREVDTRSGDGGLQPVPTIRLLDEYQLVVRSRPGMSLGLGVWSGLDAAEQAYPELLGFGLKVLFPAKFSGLRLTWQPLNTAADTVGAAGAGARKPLLTTALTVFQGNEDRVEALAPKHDTFDVAPSARDPYYGTALRLSTNALSGLDLTLLLGFLDQADAQGRFDEVFGQFSAEQVLALAGRQAKVSFEARYLRSRGRQLVEPQTLESASLSTSIAVAPDLWALAGVDLGKGDRWTSDNLRNTTRRLQGYELEAGVLGYVGPELSLQLMLSREYRTLRDAGGKSGGFQDAAGQRTVGNRLGLELTYKINKNA